MNPSAPGPRASSPSVNISRRRFLSRCATLAAMTGLPLWFIERQQALAADAAPPPSPNDRPGIALIGCGGMGKGDAKKASAFGEIVAVCDVDANHAAAAAKLFTVGTRGPTVYADVR
jgi:hypothetical protein